MIKIIFNKKIIFALFLISVFVVGLQIAQPVCATGGFDIGSFKVNGKEIMYNAWKDSKKGKTRINIDFVGKEVPKKYENIVLIKTKNQIKTYSVIYDKNFNTKTKLLKTYRTTKSMDSFYKSTFKKIIINQVKKSIKQ